MIVIANGLASLLHICKDYSHSFKKSAEHSQQMALTDNILLLPTSSKHGRQMAGIIITILYLWAIWGLRGEQWQLPPAKEQSTACMEIYVYTYGNHIQVLPSVANILPNYIFKTGRRSKPPIKTTSIRLQIYYS